MNIFLKKIIKLINKKKEIKNLNVIWIIWLFIVVLSHVWNSQAYSNLPLKTSSLEYINSNFLYAEINENKININWKDYLLVIKWPIN